jgi:hypothetical protein
VKFKMAMTDRSCRFVIKLDKPDQKPRSTDLTLHDVWQNAGEDGTDALLKL